MEPTQCSETSAFSIQTLGIHPKENLFHLTHGGNLKSRKHEIGNKHEIDRKQEELKH
jgi:hypothetical protein